MLYDRGVPVRVRTAGSAAAVASSLLVCVVLSGCGGSAVSGAAASTSARLVSLGPCTDCFGAPKELFDLFWSHLRELPEASWYIGRDADGAIVSTALGLRIDGATGVFNVATPSEHRGHGYGAALTSRLVRDGFEAGSAFAFLQSSDLGHGVYQRLGFRDAEEYVLFTRPLSA